MVPADLAFEMLEAPVDFFDEALLKGGPVEEGELMKQKQAC